MEWQILRENPQNDKNPWEQPCLNTPNATKGHSSCISIIPRPLLNLMLDPISVPSWAAGRVFGLSVAGILGGEKQRVKAGTVFYSDIPQFKNNLSTSSLTHSMKGGKFLLWSFKRRCAKEEQEKRVIGSPGTHGMFFSFASQLPRLPAWQHHVSQVLPCSPQQSSINVRRACTYGKSLYLHSNNTPLTISLNMNPNQRAFPKWRGWGSL